MAKKSKVMVEKFSLGFGPAIFSRKIKDTKYIVSLIPLGGYVKLAGDNLEEYKGQPYEYFSKSCKERARIVLMGPILNYLLALVSFWMIFYLGYPMLTSTVGEVLPDYGASLAGIAIDDTIVAVDGIPVKYWNELQRQIYSKKEGQSVILEVLRQNKYYTFEVKIKEKEITNLWGKKKKIGLIGIRPKPDLVFVKYGIFSSIIEGTKKVVELTFITYNAILRIIVGKLSLKESVIGPLGMFYLTQEATRLGFIALLHLVGVLNISLAVFNLLPIPIMDGGHLLLLAIEKIRGRQLSYKVERIFTQLGLGFIITLAIFIFYNDLVRFGLWERILKILRP
ncbi:MAG: site-2 protease family protein [Candidatus Omnitrophica bacterium]|nr:site-2 protease family protein [Candidatus Omnitrophota bacterium]